MIWNWFQAHSSIPPFLHLVVIWDVKEIVLKEEEELIWKGIICPIWIEDAGAGQNGKKNACLYMFAHVQCRARVGFQKESKNQKKLFSSTEPSHDKLVASLRPFLG